MSGRGQRLTTFIALLSVVSLVSGCGQSTQTSERAATSSKETSTASATSTTSTTAAPPPVAQTASLPEGRKRLGPATIYTGCTDEVGEGDEFVVGKVFDPTSGRSVPIPTPSVPPGQELIASGCTVGGVEDIRVFWIYYLRTPSSGLDPERTVGKVASFDPFASGAAVTEVELPPDFIDVELILPTDFGFMAGDGYTLHGFDPVSLAQVWRRDADRTCACSFSTNFRAIATIDKSTPSPSSQYRYVFYGTGDGAEIGAFITSIESEDQRGFTIYSTETFPYVYSYFDAVTNKLAGPVAKAGVFWDNLRLSWGDEFIEVWNRDENRMVFSRYGEEVSGLNAESIYLAGNYLYIRNDSDSPVIDLTTSQKVSSGWKVRPTQRISGEWTLVVEGEVANDAAQCFPYREDVCYDDDEPSRTLVRSVDGQYPGPWF